MSAIDLATFIAWAIDAGCIAQEDDDKRRDECAARLRDEVATLAKRMTTQRCLES